MLLSRAINRSRLRLELVSLNHYAVLPCTGPLCRLSVRVCNSMTEGSYHANMMPKGQRSRSPVRRMFGHELCHKWQMVGHGNLISNLVKVLRHEVPVWTLHNIYLHWDGQRRLGPSKDASTDFIFLQKLISRWGRRTLPPEPRHRCKTLPPLYSISP